MTDQVTGLRDQLEAIRAKHGRLTAELVVQEASAEDHPLHHRFEWDNTAAADKYRRVQAEQLIRFVRVKYREADEQTPAQHVRAFHSMPQDDGTRAYEPAEEIRDDPFKRELLLRDMERDWKTLKRRWEHFSEFVQMVREDVAA